MASIDVKDTAGSTVGSVDLDDEIFGIEPNTAVMHQVVTAQLAARRAGTQSTKTRAEVRGGGAKPWKQKGTGRARQGSIRAPQWRGGGVALGPKPRSYAQKTPKKMVRLALRSALSDRFSSERIIVLEGWGFDAPKTKTVRQALEALGTSGRVLAVIERGDVNAAKSMANLPQVHVLETSQLNTYDVLVSDWIVFTRGALPTSTPAAEEGAA
jgi:large subunit ribosomal protein L4